MMRDIAIYGAGGFGKEVACLVDRINNANGKPLWNLVGFFDDGKENGSKISHYGSVLGGIDDLNHWATPIDIVIAVGSPLLIQEIFEKIVNSFVSFPSLIDSSFDLVDQETTQIGKGNIIIGPGSLSCDVTIGDFNVLNGGVVVGHETTIGNFNVFMPGVRVSGQAVIGNNNLFGAESFVLQQLHVGDNVTLAPLSALMTKPHDNTTYLGVPAKKIF